MLNLLSFATVDVRRPREDVRIAPSSSSASSLDVRGNDVDADRLIRDVVGSFVFELFRGFDSVSSRSSRTFDDEGDGDDGAVDVKTDVAIGATDVVIDGVTVEVTPADVARSFCRPTPQ